MDTNDYEYCWRDELIYASEQTSQDKDTEILRTLHSWFMIQEDFSQQEPGLGWRISPARGNG